MKASNEIKELTRRVEQLELDLDELRSASARRALAERPALPYLPEPPAPIPAQFADKDIG